MNKILSVILLLSLLLVCFTGCSVPDNNDDEVPEGNPQTELQNTDEVIIALIDYLGMVNTNLGVMPFPPSTTDKIDRIKSGEQPLHITLNPIDFYFVCGYYSCEHKDEASYYYCKEKYTWLMFESADEIIEEYEGKDFVVAFQINKASIVTDILSEDNEVPNFEHFQPYKPTFENGLNTEASLVYDKTFIYLNSSDKSSVYFYERQFNYLWLTMPCVYFEEDYYFTVSLSGNLVNSLGRYYDYFIDVMDMERYSLTDKEGNAFYYGLIKIEDLVSCINEYNGTGYVTVESNDFISSMFEYAISVKIPEKFEISDTDIPISISYGVIGGSNPSWDYCEESVLIVKKDDEEIVIKKLDIESIQNPEYNVKQIWDKGQKRCIGLKFSHAETFYLPPSLFSGDSGKINIGFLEYYKADSGQICFDFGADISLYYTRNGTSITIKFYSE